jgi:hypothetical protein
MNIDDVDQFERVRSQITQLHKEMTVLAKSKPDNPINKFKLALINEKLQQANRFLVGSFKPIDGFELFEESDLPSNSDVVLVTAQYLSALEGWRSAQVAYDPIQFQWYWKIEERRRIGAEPPSGFRKNLKDKL